jgi:acyl-CoA synthetase (NDP forming)
MEQKLLEQLEKIFNPKSVAIVGVSNKEYNLGYRWLKSLQDAGFPTLYPVNPKGGEMLGLKVYPSIKPIFLVRWTLPCCSYLAEQCLR